MMRIAVVVTMLAACGGGSKKTTEPEKPVEPAAPKDPVDIAIAGLTEWKTKMCACTDQPCADKTHDEYKAWETNVAEPMFKDMKLEDIPKDKLAAAEKLDEERKACRRKLRKDDGATVEEAMAKMAEFRDKLCACKDADCAKMVSDEMTQWSMEQAKAAKEPPKMSEDDMKKATEIGTQMGECMQKAMGQ